MTTSASSEEWPLEEEYIEHPLQHCQQRYSWDCGVACVLMLLDQTQRAHFLQNFDAICQQEGFYKSTWTIDLCYLLKRYNIDHTLYTTMLGVNEGYKKYSYYKDIIDKDRDRVASRFSEAASHGIPVEHSTLTMDALRQHMPRGPAVLLVDGPLLVCNICKHNKMRHEIRRIFGGSYRGHYVLVTGCDRSGARWSYRDPALPDRRCTVSAHALMGAHRAQGTDNDVILVHRDYRAQHTAD